MLLRLCGRNLRRSYCRPVHSSATLYAKSRPPWSKDPPPQRELTYKPGCEDELPFHVNRIELSKQLPVYRDYRNGNTRIVTILRKYEGDYEILADEMKKVCGESDTRIYQGRIE